MVRTVLARILFILAIPIVFAGLIDPLEGGIALLLAGLIYFLAFQLAGTGPRRILWVSYLVAIVIGGLTLLYAMVISEQLGNQSLGVPPAAGVWMYRVAVLATLSGAVSTAIYAFGRSAK
jgi:hypothetical protein